MRMSANQMIALLAMLHGREEATAAELYQLLVGKYEPLSLDSISVALVRMRKSGLVDTRISDPPPGKGGKPRVHYQLSRDGEAVLREAKKSNFALRALMPAEI